MIERSIRYGFLALIAALLMSCGGSTGGDGGGGGSDDPPPGGDPAQEAAQLGSFDTGGDFTEGEIAANQTSLVAGESSNLSVSLVDQDGNPITDQIDVFFNSPCIIAGTSEVEPAVATTSSGTVNATYTARGCDGSDTVTARVNFGGNNLTATVTLSAQQAPLGSIQFDSVTESVIGIEGSGSLPEQSVVSFLVTNNSGGPVPNQQVSFSLNTTVGGITLSNSQGTTDANGRATTTVNSGAIATTVRVTARATRDGVTTEAQSSGLAITTGIPDFDSFSVSAEILNFEGFDYDNETVAVTLSAADRFNNPVPDGTAITFTTEGGAIPGSCVTSGGTCTVDWRSQDPRPADGRATILVTAIGEESFTDSTPSNGRFDSGETFFDLPEAFRDDDEDGVRDDSEPFVDFNSDGSYNPASGDFTGLLCNDTSFCDSDGSGNTINTLTVWRNIDIVMSGSSLFIEITPNPIDLTTGAKIVTVSVQDARGQVPPFDTTIAATATQGSVADPSSFVQQSTNAPGPAVFEFLVEPDENENGDGLFRIEVTTPNNVISSATATIDQTP